MNQLSSKFFQALSFGLVLAIFGGDSALAHSPLKVENRYFKDQQGRVVLLRGFNLSQKSKVPDFMPLKDDKLLNPLKDLGTNAIRLLFNWEAYEPKKGEYNQAYLDYYKNLVKKAEELGIFVIVDFHQDGYSRFSIKGCGEGFPEWALPPGIKKYKPKNDKDCETWYNYLIGKDTKKTFNHFYQDTYGVKTKYLDLMKTLARTFKDSPNVIGFDPINEPWGSVGLLSGLYEDAAKVIREEFPSAILFLSPHGMSSTGIFKLSLPRPTFTNISYAPHYYAISINPIKHWSGIDPKYMLRRIQGKAKCLDAPLYLGEFGAPNDAKGALEYVQRIYNYMDASFSSGAQWDYNPGWNPKDKDGWNIEDFSVIDDEGNLRQAFRPRPFVRAISGNPISLTTKIAKNQTGFTLKLKWDHTPNSGGTEIFVPNLQEKWGKMMMEFGKQTGPDQGMYCSANFQKNLITCDDKTAGKKELKILLK